jgi:hypothetical protein
MAPLTRNTTRNLPLPSTDVEMEDVNTQLTFPDPQAHTVAIQEPSLAIQPVYDQTPTHQSVSTPNYNLTALLADIPSTVHIENLAFSVSQQHVTH